MKTIISAFLFLGILNVNAQQNIFLHNDFWDEETTIKQVKEAIENGNDPVAFSESNFDATAYAILNNSPLETLLFLLDIEGNEVTKITHDARNYLMWAAFRGNYELTKVLMEKGSDIHIVDDKGNNLQTYTAMGGVTDQRIYELFKAYGLKLNAPNRTGATILHYLAQHVEDVEDFKYFIDNGLHISAKDKNESTVFHYASAQGNIDLLNQLIAEGLDPKVINKNNENALFFAARGKRRFSNELPVFEYLVGQGLDPNLINSSGNNLLHYLASGNKNERPFNYFIEQDVDLQKVNDEGNTPLMNAAERNNKVGINALYELTKDKNLVNEKGHSLLTFALRNKNSELAAQQIVNGADFQLVDRSGDNLITHLVATYEQKNKSFFTEYFKISVTKGVEVQNRTLHLATRIENEFLVNTLLDAGVDINARNKDGITALQLAAMKGDHTDFLKFLLRKGADKSIKTDFDESVYELAKSNELLEDDLEFLK